MDTKFDIAWKRAPMTENKHMSGDLSRLCYLCVKPMMRANENSPTKEGWTIDYIDGDKNNKVNSNLVAAHFDCANSKNPANQALRLAALVKRYGDF